MKKKQLFLGTHYRIELKSCISCCKTSFTNPLLSMPWVFYSIYCLEFTYLCEMSTWIPINFSIFFALQSFEVVVFLLINPDVDSYAKGKFGRRAHCQILANSRTIFQIHVHMLRHATVSMTWKRSRWISYGCSVGLFELSLRIKAVWLSVTIWLICRAEAKSAIICHIFLLRESFPLQSTPGVSNHSTIAN